MKMQYSEEAMPLVIRYILSTDTPSVLHNVQIQLCISLHFAEVI